MTYLFHQLVLSLPPLALVPYMSQKFFEKFLTNAEKVFLESNPVVEAFCTHHAQSELT